ncbi:CLUMA_CG014897, isoform A [Clunio marinus]|uniref:CLUMA_CG014897, isoform A n=1 Tax=Clunio marinus TaxID=568069 RepID=A0A1J1IRH4_9DIPT|nr:CLUMA_CG014897, isoform A [Clunio marinus]
MYKRNNMLREKRKHANYKPNRRLDAKSSRGMIYENEELRIRTININAEVERGQSEIKTLKREREQLRREIWTLRDEYDKLENLLRIDPDEFLNQNKTENGDDDDQDEDENASDCSECSCEICCGDECCDEKTQSSQKPETNDDTSSEHSKVEAGTSSTSTKVEVPQSSSSSNKSSSDEHNKRSGKDRLNLNFDHLSVVSEEGNSEGNSMIQNEDSSIPIHDLSAFLHSVDVLSPLSYLQKLNPPLAHFENLNFDEFGASSQELNYDQVGNSGISIEDVTPQTVEQSPSISKFNMPNAVVVPPPIVEQPTTSEPVKKESRLKHFFSPIRKKPIVPSAPPMISHPDVFVSNIIPNNMYINPTLQLHNSLPDNTVKLRSVPHSLETTSPTSSFQTGGNLEELLYDIEALSKDIMNLQTQCSSSTNDNENVKKPFRSELNLVLSYPQGEGNSQDMNNSDNTPPIPTPMDIIHPLSHTNPLLLQNLPSPFPSPIPSSPLTPPTHFKTNNTNIFEDPPDYIHLNFPPINSSLPPVFSTSNSVFCTVSAPSTPASDRKCIDKFCANEPSNDNQQQRGSDKKKGKRVSIVNASKEDGSEKGSEGQEVNNNESKEADLKNHSHLHQKRRMSLDNNVICHDPNAKVQRRESNRSSSSFKKRSRSDSFGGHGDDQGGTSVSERYSNSLASSRESSTSLSVKSGKRRISITSYGESKKIPWCGCWGNSCL